MEKGLSVLIRRWHLSWFAFMRFFVNYSKRFSAVFSRDIVTCRSVARDTEGCYHVHIWQY